MAWRPCGRFAVAAFGLVTACTRDDRVREDGDAAMHATCDESAMTLAVLRTIAPRCTLTTTGSFLVALATNAEGRVTATVACTGDAPLDTLWCVSHAVYEAKLTCAAMTSRRWLAAYVPTPSVAEGYRPVPFRELGRERILEADCRLDVAMAHMR